MEHQEQCILEGEGVQGSGSPSENEEPSHRSDRLHFRFSLESDGQWERRWTLHFFEFYNGRSPLWSHGKHFPWPGRSMIAIWNDEEYLVANLTEKTDYARAEICKFNPCLCIISLNTGIIFFSYSVFKKVSRDRKHCNSNLFNIPGNSTSLLKPKICLRWVSEVLKYIKLSTFT